MSKIHKIGMIGLDTSHVEAFAKLLSNPNGIQAHTGSYGVDGQIYEAARIFDSW